MDLFAGIVVLLSIASKASAECGVSERIGDYGNINYVNVLSTDVENCLWTLVRYDTRKTMLIVTVNDMTFNSNYLHRLILPGGLRVPESSNETVSWPKCYRFKHAGDTLCGENSNINLCSSDVQDISAINYGKYQIMSISYFFSFSLSYRFVKCEGQNSAPSLNLINTSNTNSTGNAAVSIIYQNSWISNALIFVALYWTSTMQM